MTDTRIQVPYNSNLSAFEALLSGVRRPGDFFVQGSLELPMPRIDVDGVGTLAFPIAEAQVRTLIEQAERAPYGRGAETLVDTNVRRVWQIAPARLRLSGKSWERSFRQILTAVKCGLGCELDAVTAEFYKLLIYDEGGFFLAHRDTEKSAGMFGTLMLVLPSIHRGGELVIRHSGREAIIDLSGAETSEIGFAAFYADCEHEVRPITAGNRVCLVFNLLRRASASEPAEELTAPDYALETVRAVELLREAFASPTAPVKLAWLLEHQYSPAQLSFAGLKGADAAVARLLRQAAESADCVAHLGIVHIEESGPAEPDYDSDYGLRGNHRYRDCDEDGDEDGDEEDADGDAFDVVEVSDGSRTIDQWIDVDDCPVAFGALPVQDGEVLPAGALDDEAPDEQRLLEASGNEGASFERAYHRAALVLWPKARFVEVLLQAGVAAAVPYLDRCVTAQGADSEAGTESAAALAIAERIVAAWEAEVETAFPPSDCGAALRGRMLELLVQLSASTLLEYFVRNVIDDEYEGDENAALAQSCALLGAGKTAEVLTALLHNHMQRRPRACIELFALLTDGLEHRCNADWRLALCALAEVIVEALPGLTATSEARIHGDWWNAQITAPIGADSVAQLLVSLGRLASGSLRERAAAALTANIAFDPGTVLVPALQTVLAGEADLLASDPECAQLWLHGARFLLARSEHPPTPPIDWQQAANIPCDCEDCRALKQFARDAAAQTHRFRVRKDRRQHLHRQIDKYQLDMTHVTERIGSPQTLICSKTRRRFEQRCRIHAQDLAALERLATLPGAEHVDFQEHRNRIHTASCRHRGA